VDNARPDVKAAPADLLAVPAVKVANVVVRAVPEDKAVRAW